jgi:histidyl-tRNA synthetase
MTDSYKGVRDFYPEDQRIQNFMFGAMRRTVESYGYEEYNASILEPTELYAAKSSDEIVSEQTYTFEDRGGRSVTLRPEMTPTVARMVANRKRELGYPLRWYCIQNFFRYDRQQRGRLREFWQLNVDLFGVPGIEGDVEIIETAYRTLTGYGATSADFKILVGSRTILTEAFARAGLSAEQQKSMRMLLDKRAKMEPAAFLAARKEITPEPVEDMLGDITGPMAELLIILEKRGIPVTYDPSVVRGFEYYTDIVFEAFDTNPANTRSILGGGRYDSLVEKYGSEPVAAVGFAMGDVVLRDFLETHNLMPPLVPSTRLYLAAIGDVDATDVIDTLRASGVNVAVGMKHDKISDHIRSADKLGIPYFAAFGDNEAQSGEIAIKHLSTGTETKIALDKVYAFLLGS